MAANLVLALLPAAAADFADLVDGAKKSAQNIFKAPPPPAPTAGGKTFSIRHNLATFWDRNSPYDFVYEALAILGLVFYLIVYLVGKSKNETVARQKFGLIYRQLFDNFALVGPKPGAAPLLKENDEEFLSYVSGRVNVEYAHITISTAPRQDPLIGRLVRSIYGMYFDQKSMEDRLVMEFTLPSKFEGFVFGLVNKSVMRFQRIDNWDLQFTKTNDAPFSNHFVIMSEVAEVTEKMMSSELVLVAGDLQDSLEYLVISDQPTKQPKGEMNKSLRTLRISILLGKRSANETNVNSFLAVVFSIIDSLPKSSNSLSQNSIKKLNLARDEAYKAIAKQVAAEEAEDAPKRLTRKEIRDKEAKDRISKLSAKDQKKALDKERERQLKKGQKQMTRKA